MPHLLTPFPADPGMCSESGLASRQNATFREKVASRRDEALGCDVGACGRGVCAAHADTISGGSADVFRKWAGVETKRYFSKKSRLPSRRDASF